MNWGSWWMRLPSFVARLISRREWLQATKSLPTALPIHPTSELPTLTHKKVYNWQRKVIQSWKKRYNPRTDSKGVIFINYQYLFNLWNTYMRQSQSAYHQCTSDSNFANQLIYIITHKLKNHQKNMRHYCGLAKESAAAESLNQQIFGQCVFERELRSPFCLANG